MLTIEPVPPLFAPPSRTKVSRIAGAQCFMPSNGPVRLTASVRFQASTVVLTINNTLQEICERELRNSVDSLHAQGGDIVVMNPHTGEILALASTRDGRTTFSNTAVTEPFERKLNQRADRFFVVDDEDAART